ncbi:ssDNA endodeoxyribonuclease [Sticta canariensis]|nr:ssDNA endodeoxyribonuclease [Sticta canariensis]
MSLNEVWVAAAGHPFHPVVAKERQFLVGFTLLLTGFVLTGLFSLNRSLKNILILGIPASLAFSFGAVYMICAVGVYV